MAYDDLIWDAAGVLVFDGSSVVVKFLGSYTVPTNAGANGSFSDSRLTAYAQHIPFIARIGSDQPDAINDPVVTIAGNTISWAWPTSARRNFSFVYGIK